MIDCYVYTRKIADIKVPHSIYELFLYEDEETCNNTNIHYSMYRLNILKNDIEDYDLDNKDIEFIEENYSFCENLFENENINEIRFLDEDFYF